MFYLPFYYWVRTNECYFLGLTIISLIGALALTALRQIVEAEKNVSSVRVLHHLADLADAGFFFFFILTAAIELK